MRYLKILGTVTMLVIGLTFGACSEDDDTAVRMESGQRFEPEVLAISVNETVIFANESSDAHTVTAYEDGLPDGASYFASGGLASEDEARDDVSKALLPPGDPYRVTFNEPGTYDYFCIPHESEGMKGTVVVEG